MSDGRYEREEVRIARQQLEETQAVYRLLKVATRFLRHIAEGSTPPRITTSIGIQFSGDTMAFNVLALNVGQTSIATIVPLETDGVTPSGGTVSAAVFSASDATFTAVLNSDGVTATITGVSANTGSTGTAQCTVTDTDGAVAQFSQGFTVTVSSVVPPPPPTQLTQSIGVSFSTPQ